ncbi:MAG: hypothetical protein ACREV9_12795 [Burkholderiales bacterium]
MSKIWIATALDRLRADITAANQIGNVEGHLARHLLNDDSRLGIQWAVDCDEVWVQGSYDPSNLGNVASLAYTMAHTGNRALLQALEAGLKRAAARDPKVAGHGAALHDPAVFIGLCLGAKVLADRSTQYLTWCAAMTRQLAQGPRGSRSDPMVAYASSLCTANTVTPHLDLQAPLVQRAALDWWYRQPKHHSKGSIELLTALRTSVVEHVLSEQVEHLPAHHAALLWRCLRAAVSQTTAAVLQTPATIVHALRQFETSMKRWRWDSEQLQCPVQWRIRSEREVQDILWLMLRPICEDIEDEDTLPKFGHSSYRADFGIPSLGLLIEVKYARSATEFKAIEKQVLEDLVPYLKTPDRYREVVIFIYDASSSVQQHDTTARALRSVPGITDVIIVCRPSQLPTE